MALKITCFILIVLVDIALYYGIKYLDRIKQSGAGYNATKANVPLSSGSIFYLCFPEGFVIFTEDRDDAVHICKQMGLNANPYWSSISVVYDTADQAVDAINQVKSMLGNSFPSFVKKEFVGLKVKVTYQGYVSTQL